MEELKQPTPTGSSRRSAWSRVRWARDFDESYEITWPDDMHSVLVIAVSLPEEQPELDWW